MESSGTPIINEEEWLVAKQLCSFTCLPMAMKAAIELDVLQIISSAASGLQISPAQIVAQIPNVTNPDAAITLDRFLRILASHSLLTCSVTTGKNGKPERVYGLTPLCKYLVANKDGKSLAQFALMNQDKVFIDSWFYLKHAVLDGSQPFIKAHGVHAFEYPSKDQRFNAIFNKAMSEHSAMMMEKILEIYQGFKDLEELVDVGGGVGSTINLIVSKYPHIKGLNFDLPHVVKDALQYPGVTHVGGDKFESMPSRKAIFMEWILHHWSDDHCIREMSLSSDIVTEILKRVDGITVARAECCSSEMRSVVKEQSLWEDACSSLWPSTKNCKVKRLICSLGGFNKFYADCFPLINISQKDCQDIINPLGGDAEVSLSDFVSIVDIHYKNESIYSKVVSKISGDGDVIDYRSSTIYPLVIDLPFNCDGTLISVSTNGDKDAEEIIISTNQDAVNLSSWRPLEVHKHNRDSKNDFTIRFGSILPAHDALHLKLAACNVVVKGTVDVGKEDDYLQISGVSLQLEDMMGCQVNATDGVLVLQRAVKWGKRSKNYERVIQNCYDVLEIQSDFMEENLGGQCQLDPLCMLFLIGLAIISCYLFFKT